jgi:hypothetical protein
MKRQVVDSDGGVELVELPVAEQNELNVVRREEDDDEDDRRARLEAQKAVLDRLSTLEGLERGTLAAAFGWRDGTG